MANPASVIGVFENHEAAEKAVKALASSGIALANLSVLGRGYHTEENAIGFYNTGDRITFWGGRGAFWGGLWSLFFGGLFITIPAVGPIVALGYLAASMIAAIEGAVVVGGLSAIAAALYSIGIPRDSVIQYEAAVRADSFLVMARGTAEEVAHAKSILDAAGTTHVASHHGTAAKVADASLVAIHCARDTSPSRRPPCRTIAS